MRRLYAIAIITTGCTASRPPAAPLAVGPELAAIFAEDQRDRAPAMLAGLSPAVRDSVMQSVVARDKLRRARVEELMAPNTARTAADYFHAAVVLQHGRDTAASLKAHAWAKRAVELGSTEPLAKGLIAGSWDQYLYGKGLPQWYGTIIRGGLREPARLYDIDTTKVTDQERLRLGLRTLAQMRAAVDSLNARRRP